MRVAVVGHVEWVEFARVESVPRAGEIVHALETWQEPAGGGAVAAAQLARLAGSCVFLTALGADELGRRSRSELTGLGIDVRAIPDAEPTRRAFTYVDETGERTITVLGQKLRPSGGDSRLPWRELAGLDAVYFVSGDAEALHHARLARVLVASARELPTLREAGVQLDALVGSGDDEGELDRPGPVRRPTEQPLRRRKIPLLGWTCGGRWFKVGRSGNLNPAPGCCSAHTTTRSMTKTVSLFRLSSEKPSRTVSSSREASTAACTPTVVRIGIDSSSLDSPRWIRSARKGGASSASSSRGRPRPTSTNRAA